MKAIIITAALASFAAAANEQIQALDIGASLKDIHLANDGTLTALLSTNTGTAPASPGSLHTVEVLSGSQKKVQEALDKILDENPYASPLKLAVMDVFPELKPAKEEPAKPDDKDKSPAQPVVAEPKSVKPKRVFVVVVGYVQP